MGVVYKAFDRKRQEIVALKTLHLTDPTALFRLKQEFRVLSDITHPNLVALYELFSDGRQCFFTMELVEGVNFLSYVRSGVVLLEQLETTDQIAISTRPTSPERQLARIDQNCASSHVSYDRIRKTLRQLVRALALLHEMGKLHRDVKPSNLMVTNQGRVVLLDFGLATELDWAGKHQSSEQHLVGTIAYMAPEQAASQPLSPASDWYSVGVMLYEALTGQLPFTGNPLQVLQNKQQVEPLAPRELVPYIPVDLDDLCVALLRRSPEVRPSGPQVLSRLGSEIIKEDVFAFSGPSNNPRASFVGRETHLSALEEAYSDIKRGRPIQFYVRGKSGAGKSMLVEHFIDGLLTCGEAVVLAGKCHERESVPYKALDNSTT